MRKKRSCVYKSVCLRHEIDATFTKSFVFTLQPVLFFIFDSLGKSLWNIVIVMHHNMIYDDSSRDK